ncbi:hypothetical protein GALL_543930 [mine drainage metagenome]|uniref:Uncharacterized protein n=1 Tax=mine drainage metagenome TaxID=410659 RepID=A0A1J5PFM8_9ZZZZ
MVACMLLHRDRFAGHHGFVDRTVSLHDLTIHRDLFAGTHAQHITHLHLLQWNVFLLAVTADNACSLGRQAQQQFDRRVGAATRPQFQHLSQQHQRGNHRSCFEIDWQRTIRSAQRRRENVRHKSADHAVNPSHAYAQCDQGEHVEMPGKQRCPATLKERPTTPQHDWCSQYEFDELQLGK